MQGQIDTPTQHYIPIKVLAREIPGRNGQPIHWMTFGRWCRPPGLGGFVLESAIIGNQRCVTRNSLARFIQAVTRAADGERPVQAIASRRASRRTRPSARRSMSWPRGEPDHGEGHRFQ